MEQLRWPLGLACPRCSGRTITRFSSFNKTGKRRRLYQCRNCEYQYSVTAGTTFHNSHLSCDKWLHAIWLLSEPRSIPSVRDVEESLRIPYKTAWEAVRRINEAKTNETKRFADDFLAILNNEPNEEYGILDVDLISASLRNRLGPPPKVTRPSDHVPPLHRSSARRARTKPGGD